MRDAWLRLRYRDHIAYYRAVMASDAARSAEAAVGHGLRPHHRTLEIGCGNLRAGRLFID